MSGTGSVQLYNSELVDNLLGILQARNDPNFAWKTAVGMHQNLNGLRGFWPLTSRDENDAMYDLSGQGRTLTNNSAMAFGVHGLATYAIHDGAGDYGSRADEAGLDITAGLTLGCWVYLENAPGADTGIISKWTTTGNQRAYLLNVNSTPTVEFQVSSNGTATISSGVSATLTEDRWYHIAGRYDPSTALDIFLNGVKVSNTTSIPAAINNATAPLNLGAHNAGAVLLDGRTNLPFLCAAVLSDATIQSIYHHTRALFGVG